VLFFIKDFFKIASLSKKERKIKKNTFTHNQIIRKKKRVVVVFFGSFLSFF